MDKKNNVLRSILIAVIAGVLLSLGKGIRHTSSVYGDLSPSVSPGVTVSVTETAQAVTEAPPAVAEAAAAPTEAPPAVAEATAAPTEAPHESAAAIDPGGIYTSAEDVALYIHSYGTLPENFITKKEAKDLGWSGGSLEGFAPGKCIGGDYFGNYEGLLPDTDDYHECDIDTLGKNSRGAKRLIYSSDGRIYYTEDHYSSFKQLY
ncbi:MAG: ribonuclease [Lachnospiraceae bacterium]|nr:ribonuclease [Lachnospiraceae bacterium]